jgi:hypothetical protein
LASFGDFESLRTRFRSRFEIRRHLEDLAGALLP